MLVGQPAGDLPRRADARRRRRRQGARSTASCATSRAQGVGIVVISSELPELIGVCDRVLVVREGRIAGEVEGDEMTEENDHVSRLASAKRACTRGAEAASDRCDRDRRGRDGPRAVGRAA